MHVNPPSQQCYRPSMRSNLIVLNGFPEIIGAREVGHWEREEKGPMKLFVPGSS